jgi:hypothetical protein
MQHTHTHTHTHTHHSTAHQESVRRHSQLHHSKVDTPRRVWKERKGTRGDKGMEEENEVRMKQAERYRCRHRPTRRHEGNKERNTRITEPPKRGRRMEKIMQFERDARPPLLPVGCK